MSARAIVGTLSLLLSLPAAAQLITHRDLSLSMALAMATGALDACKARGYTVSVVVVDRGGDTLVALRGDEAGPHTMENARRKAYTARTFRMTTEEYIKVLEANPGRRAQTTRRAALPIGSLPSAPPRGAL